MKLLYILIILLSFSVGCFTPHKVVAKAHPHYEIENRHYACPNIQDVKLQLSTDVKFNLTEILALIDGANSISTFTKGYVDVKVVIDDDPLTISVHKVWSKDPVVVGHDMTRPIKTKSMAWSNDADIYLIMDRIPVGKLKGVFMHELGHFVGFGWPNCNSDKLDCWHSPNPSALMYFEYTGAMEFNQSDYKFCRASCLCQAKE